jgi:hypothetical protein
MWPASTSYYWGAHARHAHSSRSSRTGYILCRTTGGPAPFSGEAPGICSGHYLLTQSQTSAGKTASALNFRWGAAAGEFARRENRRGSCVSPWERYHPGAGPNAVSDVGDARMAATLPLYRFVREQPDCARNKSPIFSGSDRRGLSLALHPLRVTASGVQSADKPVSLRRAFKLPTSARTQLRP